MSNEFSFNPFNPSGIPGHLEPFEQEALKVAMRIEREGGSGQMQSYARELLQSFQEAKKEEHNSRFPKQVQQALMDGVPIAIDIGVFKEFRVFELSDRNGVFMLHPDDFRNKARSRDYKQVTDLSVRVHALVQRYGGALDPSGLEIRELAAVILNDQFDENFTEIEGQS